MNRDQPGYFKLLRIMSLLLALVLSLSGVDALETMLCSHPSAMTAGFAAVRFACAAVGPDQRWSRSGQDFGELGFHIPHQPPLSPSFFYFQLP